MAQQKSREELIEMVQKLIDATLPEEDLDSFLEEVERNVPHRRTMNLIYHTNPQLTAEEVVDKALSYRPVEL